MTDYDSQEPIENPTQPVESDKDENKNWVFIIGGIVLAIVIAIIAFR